MNKKIPMIKDKEGRLFAGQVEAAAANGCGQAYVSRLMAGKIKKPVKYSFEWVMAVDGKEVK